MGEVHHFLKRDCVQDITTWAQEHFVVVVKHSALADDCILFLVMFYTTVRTILKLGLYNKNKEQF